MEELEAYLISEGFYPNRPTVASIKHRFTGSLVVSQHSFRLELRFDRGHYDYPEVYLLDWPFDPGLRQLLGTRSINSSGKVCHTDESQTWWDSSQAAAMTAGVLFKIGQLLEENISGEKGSDIVFRDFDGYWDCDQNIRLASKTTNSAKLQHIIDPKSQLAWLVVDNVKYNWLPLSDEAKEVHKWITVHLKEAPYPCDRDWPPKNYKQLQAWVTASNSNAITTMIGALKKLVDPENKKKFKPSKKSVGILFTWPMGDSAQEIGCGITFTLDRLAVETIVNGRLKSVPAVLEKYNPKIMRYSVKQSDPDYIQSRNTPASGESLKDKKIVMIGAGAIGGFLSETLCSMGAGYGKRGSFDIIDFDVFDAENIGRHILGFQSIGKYKVDAIVGHLTSSYPYLTINSHASFFTEKLTLISKCDWLIDATGSQTVSIAISDYLSSLEKPPQVLHSWIQGQGIATCSFIKPSSSSACYRCLWKQNNNTYSPRYPLAIKDQFNEPTIVGCHKSFHPYVSTTALQAASQAARTLQDHLDGKLKNTLQFNIINPDQCQSRPDTTPSVSKDCPFCSSQ